MRGLLVLWDIDFTLLNAGGVGRAVYVSVFRELFGRDPVAVAPMAGRTERAIIRDTLAISGISDPRAQVDAFVAELGRRAPGLREEFAARGHALPGAVAALATVAALGARAAVQSVLTGNVRPVAEAKLAAFGLDGYLDLAIGAYGEEHEIRAELVHLARARAGAAYGRDFGGPATVLVGDTPLDVAAGRELRPQPRRPPPDFGHERVHLCARIGDPGDGERVEDDRPLGPARHRRHRYRVAAEQLAEHRDIHRPAHPAGVEQGEVDIPQHQQAAHTGTLSTAAGELRGTGGGWG